ncbi:MAG: hypothetical protein AAGA86_08220, partial [Bacteroidota bacterium]
MQHFSSLAAYCRAIGISPPRWKEFDIRRFEDNMKTVHPRMPQFKHEFYAIALKLEGGGFTSVGNYTTKDLKATVFFNSPYQIISWDIAPDWSGFYVIFSEDFYRHFQSLNGKPPQERIIADFPFLLIDNAIPMAINHKETELYAKLYSDMLSEYELDKDHSKTIIAHYLNILLLKVARLYKSTVKDIRHDFADAVSQYEAAYALGLTRPLAFRLSQARQLAGESTPYQP